MKKKGMKKKDGYDLSTFPKPRAYVLEGTFTAKDLEKLLASMTQPKKEVTEEPQTSRREQT
jgi:hypothetical protein